MAEKQSPKLQEEYTELDKKKIEKKLEENKAALEKAKKRYRRFKIRQLRNELIFSLVIAILAGFILWVWWPEQFSILKALSLGVAWHLLFEELKLHRMFKKE